VISMWHEELPPGTSWTSIWSAYILCCECSGIRPVRGACTACGSPQYSAEPRIIHLDDGRQVSVFPAFMGAEGRYEDYIYLRMMEREWKRPMNEGNDLIFPDPVRRPSSRASLVLLFWTYFETRIERLLRGGMRQVPARLAEDTLQRHSSIGSRLNRLYRVLFGVSYGADLTELGYDDIWQHLTRVQERRNAFAHGQPAAIDDALVGAVVDNLKREHEAWVAVFNRRAFRSAASDS
jgi:hypothetical protein